MEGAVDFYCAEEYELSDACFFCFGGYLEGEVAVYPEILFFRD